MVAHLVSWRIVCQLWLEGGFDNLPWLREAVCCYVPLIFLLLLFPLNHFKNSVLIAFIKNKDAPSWWGFFIATLMFICAMLQTLILHQHFQYCFVTGMRLRTSITGMIYRKVRLEAFKLSNASVYSQASSFSHWIIIEEQIDDYGEKAAFGK